MNRIAPFLFGGGVLGGLAHEVVGQRRGGVEDWLHWVVMQLQADTVPPVVDLRIYSLKPRSPFSQGLGVRCGGRQRLIHPYRRHSHRSRIEKVG